MVSINHGVIDKAHSWPVLKQTSRVTLGNPLSRFRMHKAYPHVIFNTLELVMTCKDSC